MPRTAVYLSNGGAGVYPVGTPVNESAPAEARRQVEASRGGGGRRRAFPPTTGHAEASSKPPPPCSVVVYAIRAVLAGVRL
jgi:hypothetical protein